MAVWQKLWASKSRQCWLLKTQMYLSLPTSASHGGAGGAPTRCPWHRLRTSPLPQPGTAAPGEEARIVLSAGISRLGCCPILLPYWGFLSPLAKQKKKKQKKDLLEQKRGASKEGSLISPKLNQRKQNKNRTKNHLG